MNTLSVGPKFYSNIAFTSREDDNDGRRKVTSSEVATATGATGAAVAGAKTANKGTFSMFKSSGKVRQMTKETVDAVSNVRKPLTQVKGPLPKFTQAFKNTKADILKWADGVKNSNILKPLLKSKAFNAVAGTLGAVTGIFVTISGIGDIADTCTEYVSK